MQYSKGTSRHWVRGNRRQGYSITDQGRRMLEKHLWILGKTSGAKASLRLTEKESKTLQLIRGSDAYKKFRRGSELITEEDVSFMLRFPVGEDPRLASQSLAKALSAAEKAKDKMIVELLKVVSKGHKRLFTYQGGSWTRAGD